ncbi:hypothetical protein C1926_17925 [Stenotrophomonas sp. ZAC14A_NAIMI4_1]|nr:hypothetical protein C1926_17925 [Stenotrophomonas sp. ZAC14A_NAIMI4_1]
MPVSHTTTIEILDLGYIAMSIFIAFCFTYTFDAIPCRVGSLLTTRMNIAVTAATGPPCS